MISKLLSKGLTALVLVASAVPGRAMVEPEEEMVVPAPYMDLVEPAQPAGAPLLLPLEVTPQPMSLEVRLGLPAQAVPAGAIRVFRSEGRGAMGSPAWYQVSRVEVNRDWVSFQAPRRGVGPVRFIVQVDDAYLGEGTYAYPQAVQAVNPNGHARRTLMY